MGPSQLNAIAAGALLLAGSAGAASVEKSPDQLPGAPRVATPKAKGKATGKKVLFDALKGATETTRLPNTARLDARGGVFL